MAIGRILRILAALLLLALACGPARAEGVKALRGVALVIGESDYAHLPPLANPAADARAMSAVLDGLGFETTELRDLDARKLRRALANFAEDAEGADVAVVYYSGHGIEAGGENWMVPIDADAGALDSSARKLAGVSDLLRELGERVPLTIVFLDACRTNPFPPGSLFRQDDGTAVAVGSAGLGIARGVSEAAAPGGTARLGTVIGFATEPGLAALDGPGGGNSPYAAALVRHLSAMDGTEFGTVMRMVTEEVYLRTGGAQRPWVNESLTRLLYMGMRPPEPAGDESRILGERRQLLVAMASLDASQRQQVETASRMAGVPMDALYGLLKALGSGIPSDPADLAKVLDEQASRVKALVQESQSLSSTDPEMARLSRLAEDALRDGALETYVALREEAKARYAKVAAGLDAAEAELKARRLEGGAVIAAAGAAHELTADYRAAARDYRAAFDEVARWDAAQAADFKRREADAWLSEGDERGDAAALDVSIAAFGEALALSPRAESPLAWALIQNNLGNALLVRGRGETGAASIDAAVAAYRAALEVRTREAQPQLWAKTQNNLALAYMELNERSGDAVLLDQAIASYRAALSVVDKAAEPLVFAAAASNLGNALERKGGASLEEAVALHRAVLAVRPREQVALLWAGSEENLANALVSLGTFKGDAGLIRDGLASYDRALGVVRRERLPLRWASLQYNRGKGFAALAAFGNPAEHLASAVAAYRAALEEERFERTPASWAKTQFMLGEALWNLGEATDDTAARKAGVAALQESLRYYSADRNKADWAATLVAAGRKLHRIGVLTQDGAALSAAAAMLQQSLDYHTRARDEREWADAASLYASALTDAAFIGGHEGDLTAAVALWRSVMEVHTRAAVPLDWAADQLSLAGALYYLAVLRNDDGPAREGKAAVEAAVDAFRAQNDGARAGAASALLQQFDALIGQLPP